MPAMGASSTSSGVPQLFRHFKANSMPAVVQRAMFNFDSMLLQAAPAMASRPHTLANPFSPSTSAVTKIDHQSPPMKVNIFLIIRFCHSHFGLISSFYGFYRIFYAFMYVCVLR
ncbi:unnamed protein product [Gongylonema pulchrum]|uniref:Uncharacterized protein n=1 Tax=Gongylonema pulchrum TaxID=637853 RepID=A0A183DK08_9BILA|nr:unnamed protein product [Gongylonema pulchrum]